MARPKKPQQHDTDSTVVVDTCRYREGDWRCTRRALFDKVGQSLIFVEHVGEPKDKTDRKTGAPEPCHYMVNVATPRARIIIGSAE